MRVGERARHLRRTENEVARILQLGKCSILSNVRSDAAYGIEIHPLGSTRPAKMLGGIRCSTLSTSHWEFNAYQQALTLMPPTSARSQCTLHIWWVHCFMKWVFENVAYGAG